MHQTLTERKRQALIRSANSRMQILATVEDSGKLVHTWRESLPNANTLGKFSLGLGASWLIGRAVTYYMGQRSGDSVATIANVAVPSKSILRYLALQACTLVVLPFIRSKFNESNASDFAKNFTKPNLDQLFYRWLGLES